MNLVRVILAALAAVVALIMSLPVVLIVLPFWILSLLTRTIAGVFQPEFLTREQLIQFDPVVGWKPRPNLDTHHLMGDLFHIRTDDHGFRGVVRLEESDVVVFGDSFAAGYGVGERHLFANLAGHVKIKPVGTGGYSMVQEFLWMQHLHSRIASKLVVWFVYYGNDLYDNLMPDLRGYRKPFLRETDTGEWEFVSSHISAEKWPIVSQNRMKGENHLPRLGELCSDSFIARRAYSACEFLVTAGKRLCDEVEADLVVLGIPDGLQLTPEGRRYLKQLAGDPPTFDSSRPDKALQGICQRIGAGFLPGSSFLDVNCYKINDCHWNEKGHRKVNEAIARLVSGRKSIKPGVAIGTMASALAGA